MKISYNWLKMFIDFNLPPKELGNILTLAGSEVEAIEEKGFDTAGITTGKVITVDPHPDADKLTVCTVDVGDETLTAVCGAPNVEVGQSVIFAKIGAKIADGNKLKKAKIRGVESFGMVLAEDEIGISDDHSGIIVLDESIKPGTAVNNVIELDDYIYEFEITPNRPDCLSHIGMAREVKALLGGEINYPNFEVNETGPNVSKDLAIQIDDPEGCPRYTGRLVSGIKVGPSPLWLKARLHYLGIRPINNIVDISNYVLLETGHPLHAFDYDYFKANRVTIRKAKAGEIFTTLDETKRELNDGQCLITDGKKGVALGGIMGGLDSEVTDTTVNILLESAYFDPVTIRRGAKAVGLATESSRRFERGADPEMAPRANDRACRLINELAGGQIHKGIVDAYPRKFSPVKIDFRPERANKVLGSNIDISKMSQIFDGLDINYHDGSPITVNQPSFRPDLTREADLIEEIARIYGIDNIPDVYRPGGTLETNIDQKTMIRNRLRNFLVGRGFYEIFTLTLVDSRQLKKINEDTELVRLMNPLSEEMSVLRPDLSIAMIRTLKHNINHGSKDIKLYEIGTTYKPSSGDLADEKESICLGLCGREAPVSWRQAEVFSDFYSLKAELEAIFEFFKITDLKFVPESNPYLDDKCCFAVQAGGNVQGSIGKASTKAGKTIGLKQESYIAEFNFDIFAEQALKANYFKPLPKFPASDRDIALLVDQNIPVGELISVIGDAGGKIVREVFPFDLYKGKNIAEDKKSIAFRIMYRSDNKTLTDDEVDKAHNRIIRAITDKFKAELRS
ncbi:MAG: phenylalanine--tRNA ligase subunit beta [candidate division Zixibacteria bacterium]|nr:phenylalanine--tRNA ligase subunit beta [candidate division Zixibacteria bacterium]